MSDPIDDIDQNMQAAIETIRTRQENQARLNMALSLAGVGTWEWSIKKNVLVWDARMCSLFDEPLEETKTYETFINKVIPADRARVQKAIDDSLAGDAYEIDYTIQLRDGRLRGIHAKGNRYPDQDSPEKLLGVCMKLPAPPHQS